MEKAAVAIVMGVAGSGKTTIGRRLATELDCDFYDGDDYHSAASIRKMREGEPLTDEDRMPWLDRLRQLIEDKLGANACAVIACSALRQVYRKRLLPAQPALSGRVRFIYLRSSPDMARQRLLARSGHFMPATLIASQFETLEEPEDALRIDADGPIDEVVECAVSAFRCSFSSPRP